MNEMLKQLSEPFPAAAIKQRVGGGGKRLDYVQTHSVINRLNAVAGEWSWTITGKEWQKDVLIVNGILTIPGLGSREGTGVQRIDERGGEDLFKGAASDALKKAATLFGVGIELYGPDYEDADPITRPEPTSRSTGPSYESHHAPSYPDRPSNASAGGSFAPSEKQVGYVKVLAGKKKGMNELALSAFLYETYGETIAAMTGPTAKALIEEWKDLPDHVGSGLKDAVQRRPMPALEPPPSDGTVQDWNDFYKKWKPFGIHNLQDVARRLQCGLDDFEHDPIKIDAALAPPF